MVEPLEEGGRGGFFLEGLFCGEVFSGQSDGLRVSLVCVWEEGGCVCRALMQQPRALTAVFMCEHKVKNGTKSSREEEKHPDVFTERGKT